MRAFAVLAAVGAGLGLLIPMQAQSFTYGTLVGGQVKSALAYGSGSSWCLVDNGNTQFQINQAGSKAVISFAEVIYFDGSVYYALDGQTILTFSGPTGGTIHFKQTPTYPNPVHGPPFANFSQTYTAATDQIVVSFSILFPNNCTLPVYAVYDAP
jgi:hypothetical protein